MATLNSIKLCALSYHWREICAISGEPYIYLCREQGNMIIPAPRAPRLWYFSMALEIKQKTATDCFFFSRNEAWLILLLLSSQVAKRRTARQSAIDAFVQPCILLQIRTISHLPGSLEPSEPFTLRPPSGCDSSARPTAPSHGSMSRLSFASSRRENYDGAARSGDPILQTFLLVLSSGRTASWNRSFRPSDPFRSDRRSRLLCRFSYPWSLNDSLFIN